ncbi:hypothetical protein LCGC14_1217540 [marine sediment metagenome]|uniref:Uncharacterized protein n=1 Tax=marine sediment metagenome TaxID=412755 RepID=A0A0F9NUH3_9ZZZZ
MKKRSLNEWIRIWLITVIAIGIVMLTILVVWVQTEASTSSEGEFLNEFTISITPASCSEGWERINQEIFGVHRRGCYPIDFDYEKANKRLRDHLQKEKEPRWKS